MSSVVMTICAASWRLAGEGLVNRRNLDNLTRGARPVLHAAEPNWNVLRGLVARAEISIDDASKRGISLATRFSSAYSAAFWLARVALESAGYRLAGADGHRKMAFQCLANTVEWHESRWRRLDELHRLRNRFDYGDIVDVSVDQVETMIRDAQDLLTAVRGAFPELAAD